MITDNSNINPSITMRLRAYATMLMVAFLAACTSAPDPDLASLRITPAAEMARLVIYYPDKIIGTDGLLQIRLNDKQYCALSPDHYLIKEVPAGDVSVAFSFCGMPKMSYLRMKALAGNTYYIRVLPYDSSISGTLSGYPREVNPYAKEDNGLHKGPFKIERVEEAEALEALAKLHKQP